MRSLRFVLPLAAIASSGFYFTRAKVRIQVPGGEITGQMPTFSGDNLKMEDPRYEGFTNEGGKFTVVAKTGYQDFRNPSTVRLITIDSHLTQANDQWSHLVSNEGIYDTKSELLKLSGQIKVTTSTGMTAYLRTADVQTKAQIVTSTDPVRVEMSNGSTVESDTMHLDAKSKEVTFDGNVRSHVVRTPADKPGAAKPGPAAKPASAPATELVNRATDDKPSKGPQP